MNITKAIIPFQRISFTLRSIIKDHSVFNSLTHIIKFVCTNCPDNYEFLKIDSTNDIVGTEPVITYTVTYKIKDI